MEFSWILAIVVMYLLVAFLHFGFLWRTGAKEGHAAARRASGIVFLATVSLFWPVTWIVYGIDALRGRVA